MKILLALTLPLFAVVMNAQTPPPQVTFSGDPKSPIASGVGVPAGRAYFWTSGTVPSVINKDGDVDPREVRRHLHAGCELPEEH